MNLHRICFDTYDIINSNNVNHTTNGKLLGLDAKWVICERKH